ncbi:MAG: hypothetical protein E6J14_00945 [Chloroflexi bacterium]|nr:MAG: hypothetical protein E6J14_00945 [Chloroflexota bacterium]
MLRDAVADIRQAVSREEAARRRRLHQKEALRRSDEYLWCVEDTLEDRAQPLPESLVTEIARFVHPYSRRLARQARLGAREGDTTRVLDVLFDVQERIQERIEPAPAHPATAEALAG